jgi:hypothetical protein
MTRLGKLINYAPIDEQNYILYDVSHLQYILN